MNIEVTPCSRSAGGSGATGECLTRSSEAILTPLRDFFHTQPDYLNTLAFTDVFD